MKKILATFAIAALPFGAAEASEKIGKCAEYQVVQPHVHVVTVDMQCESLKLVGTPEGQDRSTTTDFARQTGVEIAINGNFYGDEKQHYRPYGLIATDGKPWPNTKDSKHHAIFACDKTNKCNIEQSNRISSYDPVWNTVVTGSQVFEDGRFACAKDAPSGCRINNALPTHPRTAIGISKDGYTAYLVVVEGRLHDYPGMTLEDLSGLFRHLNVSRGVNLDGGGSSALVIKGKRVNLLPENQPDERLVVNHLGFRLH